MTKVMISLDKEVINRLWQSRRSDSESWNRIVGHLLPAEKASCRGMVAPTRIGTACLIEILGERRECATAMDALVWCLETLVHLDGKFLDGGHDPPGCVEAGVSEAMMEMKVETWDGGASSPYGIGSPGYTSRSYRMARHPGPRTIRPGLAPVCLPPSSTATPLTKTSRTPSES